MDVVLWNGFPPTKPYLKSFVIDLLLDFFFSLK